MRKLTIFLILLLAFTLTQSLFAQGFGKNKPKYKKFDFEVYQTTHFDIYHYLKNQQVVHNLAQQSERWHHYIESNVDETIASKIR